MQVELVTKYDTKDAQKESQVSPVRGSKSAKGGFKSAKGGSKSSGGSNPLWHQKLVDDSLKYHARTFMDFHRLSSTICSVDMFKFEMIVDDSFRGLNERMDGVR